MTKKEIDLALAQWKEGLLEIAQLNREGKEYRSYATKFIESIYAYSNHNVLFKPTLASKEMFRGSLEGAISYFIAGNKNFPEDKGFALGDWVDLDFENTGYILDEHYSMVMGNKVLKTSKNDIVIANYTMAFKRDDKNNLQIVLHHSSLPYTPV